MNTRKVLATIAAAAVLITVTAVAAGAGRRHVDPHDPTDPPAASTNEAVQGFDVDGVATAEQKAEAERQGKLEDEFTEANQPGALYNGAADDQGPSPIGLSLEGVLSTLGPSRLDSMRIISVETDNADGAIYESVMYGDGSRTGYIKVYWQTLLGGEDTSVFVGEFGEIAEEGPFDIITDVRDGVGLSLRLVRVYDGAKILTVQANDIVGLEIDELISLAKELFTSLPE